MLITAPHKRLDQTNLTVLAEGEQIEQVECFKLLGVYVDNHLSWTPHMRQLSRKIIGTACMIRRIASCLTSDALRTVSHALIGSQVGYCIQVWGNASKGNIKQLQKAQNKAARIILRCRYDTPVKVLHHRLGWVFIKDIIDKGLLTTMHNIHHKTRPRTIAERLHRVRDKHALNTRSRTGTNYVLPKYKYDIGGRRFCFRASKVWNELPETTREMNFNCFKRHLKSLYQRNTRV